ncbi:hypothetical protein [Thalassospira sp. CH_XMU1458]|uniref:hypothetical protein n=1 Tax=Thalassospira sp. CH_XMU1458 TaxID=3107776 RepID=UPI00300C7B5A
MIELIVFSPANLGESAPCCTTQYQIQACLPFLGDEEKGKRNRRLYWNDYDHYENAQKSLANLEIVMRISSRSVEILKVVSKVTVVH